MPSIEGMKVSFQRQHLAMLLKYAGISFISGAVNHGFFSGERSLWTAAAGVVMFVAGAWLEHHLAVDRVETSLLRTLVWGTLLSVGLGFFTGGLQHFPDSPARSTWVVPLGFALSVAALFMSEALNLRRGVIAYGVAGTLVVGAASAAAGQWLLQQPTSAQEAHSHDGAAPGAIVAQIVTRTIEVTMDDTMRFTPSSIEAAPEETLRIVARNTGQVDHELVIGSEETIREHALAMKQGGDHSHAGAGAAISVAPGKSGELVVTLRDAALLQIACLVPGHYEAGMRGTLTVARKAARATHKH
jgi:uncharacterized cupredoxin-like copper-binding protein